MSPSKPSLAIESVELLVLGSPTSRSVRHKFLLFMNLPVYGILSQQPEWTRALELWQATGANSDWKSRKGLHLKNSGCLAQLQGKLERIENQRGG